MEKPKNLHAGSMDVNKGVGIVSGNRGALGASRERGKNWDKCDSIINKI